MYRDEKRIQIITIDGSKDEYPQVEKYIKDLKDKNNEFIKIGHDFYQATFNLNLDKDNPWPCDLVFYKQFNIPFNFRFTKSFWKRDKKKELKVFKKLVGSKKKYAFVHDDPKRNLNINNKRISSDLKIIRNDTKYQIFDYAMILENATELHLMESSFRQMAETLKFKKTKLFLYKGRGGEHAISLYNKKTKKWIGTSKKWTIIKEKITHDEKGFLTKYKHLFNRK
tara:strand:- start:313 stop:987 length:675 start_codon:yes stop_codon:yes gene_type:complete